MNRRTLFVAAAGLVAALILSVDAIPLLRGGEAWSWAHNPAPLNRLPVLVGVLLAYGVGAVWFLPLTARPPLPQGAKGSRPARLRHSGVYIWAFAGAVMVALAAAYVREGDVLWALFSRTASQAAGGEHWGSAVIDWQSGEWRDWTSVMGRYLGNVATIPPGLLMIYAAATDALGQMPSGANSLYGALLPYQCTNPWYQSFSPAEWASAWLGILTPVWAALTVFPLASVARRHGGESAARLAVLWWPLVPAAAAFIASSSVLFALGAILVQDLIERAWAHRSGVRWIMAGGVYGLGLFCNFIFLPMAALFGSYVLIRAAHERRSFRALLLHGVWFAAGAAIPWLIFYLASGQTPWAILAQALAYQEERPQSYLFGLWFNIWDWALWSGLVFALLALIPAAGWVIERLPLTPQPPLPQGARGRRTDEFASADTRVSLPALSLALAVGLIALTLTGTTRGEAGRIWLYFAPFALAAAAAWITREAAPRGVVMLSLSQAILTVVLIFALDPHPSADAVLPPSPPQIVASQPIDAVFSASTGEAFRLVAWDGEQDGDSIELTLVWESLAQPMDERRFGALLVGPDGQLSDSGLFEPALDGTAYPTSCWRPGQRIGMRVSLALPPEAAPGEWWASLAAFGDPAHPEGRFAVTTPDGVDIQAALGPIRVE